MNLTITQDNTRTETINSSIIDKLYEIAFAASSDPNSTVSLTGRLESPKGYKYKIDWLNTEFNPDLTITVPAAGQYMTFTDSALENALKTTIGDGDGVFLELLKSTNPDVNLGLNNNTNIVDARELCLIEGTSQSGDLFLMGCSNIKTIGIPCNLTYYRFLPAVTVDNIVVKNLTNYINANWANNNYSFYRNSSGWDLYTTTDGSNITKVENLTIPSDAVFSNSITQIPFYKCKSVKNVTVPSGITSLRGFNGSNILSVTFELNSALTSILNDCFYECSNLVFDVANLPLTITTIGDNTFRSCSSITGVLDLPNLTSLGQYSFFVSGVTEATDLGSITEIPQYCFLYSGLLSITLPSTCTTIKSRGLSDMTTLTTVNGMSNVTTIEDYAFYNDTNLAGTLNLPSLTTLGQSAFEGCSGITGVLNCPNLTSIGFHAIYRTNISSITNLGSVNTLTEGTLSCSSLTSVTLPSTLRTVSWGFCKPNDNIEKIIFPEGVTDIINLQPVYRSMKYIEVPSTVTSMGACFHRALEGNTANSCFMVIKATTPPDLIFYANYFNVESSGYNLNTFAGIYVPDAALSTYQDTTNLTDNQIGWKVAAVQAKLKRISLLRDDSQRWWTEYLTRVNP